MTAVLFSTLAVSALAFDRPFPQNAKRATMSPAPFPEIVIDGKLRRMAMGGRIWNQQNMIQMPSSIIGADIVVNYTEDFQGFIDRIWILTEKEAAQTPAQQRIQTGQPRQAGQPIQQTP